MAQLIACAAAEPTDTASIDALARLAGLHVDARQTLALPQARLYVARFLGEPECVGFAVVWRVGWELELMDLATHPERRRRGVASALVQTLIDAGHREGLEAILLEVRQQNQSALKLYQKHGFHVVFERKNYYRDPPDNALCMRLALMEAC